jgi:hypothetical protein
MENLTGEIEKFKENLQVVRQIGEKKRTITQIDREL